MPILEDSRGNAVPSHEFTDDDRWVMDRIIAAGMDPDMVYEYVLGYGALHEPYIVKISLGCEYVPPKN